MDKKRISEQKAQEIANILKKIEDGTVETVTVTGISPIWRTFVKLRQNDTKVFVEYVQCRKCKGLVPFMSRSGTSNVLKHKCQTPKEEIFKELPDGKIANVKQFLMDKLLAYFAMDFCPIEVCCGTGFSRMAQGLVALGDKYGNFDVKGVLPKCNSINRQISQLTEEKRRTLLDIFKEAFERTWCSISFEVRYSNGVIKQPLLATFSMHYFEKDLTALRKRQIFAVGLNSDEEPQQMLKHIIRSFNIFGGDETQLQGMKIVTPNSMLMKSIFIPPYDRRDCIPLKIKNILDDSFSRTKDFSELLKDCRNVARYIKDSGQSHQLEVEVKFDCETWASRIKMLATLTDQYDRIMQILDEDSNNTLTLNKTHMEEVVSFVSPFVEAANDLMSTEHPTANRIVLWWAFLQDHLKDTDDFSFWMKRIVQHTKTFFENELRPSMDNEIDCFLDPRYRWLKMFTHTERNEVYAKVREILPSVNDVEPTAVISQGNEEPPTKKKSI